MLPICILPFGRLVKGWTIFRLLIALIVAILVPYQLIENSFTYGIDIAIIVTDLVAYVDLYFSLLVGYYGPKQQIIVHPLKTAIHYLKGKFLLDFILCFPWERLLNQFYGNFHPEPPYNLFDNMSNVVKCIRIGQIYRLFQFYNYLTHNLKRKYYVSLKI